MIDFELLLKISEYAKKHLESSINCYQERNQKHNKIFHQILNGKIAEYCAYFYLKNKKYNCTKPDLEIYDVKNKSHDADILVNQKTKIHVKSITIESYKKYGISFLVEKNDPQVITPTENNFYMIMLQKTFLDYHCHSFIASKDIDWKSPRSSKLFTKLAYYENI